MLSFSSFGKVAVLAILSSTLVVTGCASKKSKSQVVVSPVSSTTGYAQGNYDGGALVRNSDAIRNAAAGMQSVVRFDYNSDAIRQDAAAVLNQHAAFLASNPSAKVLVAGHTDERGSREYNMSLGERRAAAVRSYLASKGANVSNIEIISFGEEQPAAAGSNEGAWSQNRRAELSY